MITYKHRLSGKHFVYIQDYGYDKALFVTPLSDIKMLELSQFDEGDDQDEDYLIRNNLILVEQAKKFHEHKKRQSQDNLENVEDLFDEMSESQKKKFLEKLLKIKARMSE